MKKIILSTLIVIFYFETQSQTQFKIQDPIVANGVSELKKTEFYTKQLKELGLTDKDVTIKTFPIRKFYSDAAGALTRSLVEADRAEFFIEATTKKNSAGVIYKLEGSIVFTRADVQGYEFGSYNSKFNNSWKVYHQNVTNFLPANQKYIVNPQTVVKLIHSGLTQGKIKPNFLSAPYEGYFNDVIQLDSISLYKDELVSGTKQYYFFEWSALCAEFTPDTGYITNLTQRTNINSEITVEIKNGEPEITNCYFINSGIEKSVFGGDRYKDAYDTLFGGIKWVGTDAVFGRKKVISTNVLTGSKLNLFLESFAKTITEFKSSESEQMLKQKLEPFVVSSNINALSKALFDKFQLGFVAKYKKEGVNFKIEWFPDTKAAKKMNPPRDITLFNKIGYIGFENKKYKYSKVISL